MTTKKTEKPAEKDQDVKAAPATTPAEPWKQHWNIRRRLLEARQLLRGTQLWQKFSLQRDFDAFSIHPLARGVEEVLGQVGVISSFSITKWQKQGNTTVIEGVVQFTSVDDGDTLEYPTVGEGIDNGDKGIGKAVSYARKMGLISALNLGIGVDNEAEETKPVEAGAAAPSMGGSPQQSTQAAPAQANGNGATHAKDTETYTLEQRGLKARAVLGRDLPQTVWTIVMNSPTASAIDDLIKMNKAEFDRFFENDNVRGEELNAIISTKRAGLMAAGRA